MSMREYWFMHFMIWLACCIHPALSIPMVLWIYTGLKTGDASWLIGAGFWLAWAIFAGVGLYRDGKKIND